jgi:Ser/Thr protein kinase RdoA (MazF antagonist)
VDLSGEQVMRGPLSRAEVSPGLFEALSDWYGLARVEGTRDLGGSSNLNLLLDENGRRWVVRVYRPWVTESRLGAIQHVRRHLAAGGVSCAPPLRTLDGEGWIVVDGRLVEVEPYVAHDAEMDSWERIEAGLPLLGRIHTLLGSLEVSADGRTAPASNHIEPEEVLPGVLRGTERIRRWDASRVERQVAEEAEELAALVAQAEQRVGERRRQLVHGDYWDNNVLFRGGRIVQVADLDFMGERARVDDLALTLYYTNSTFSDDRASERRAAVLRTLVDAYDSGLEERLTGAERAALPVALARTPLCFIAMIPSVDSERGARKLAAEMPDDLVWALAIMNDLERWQEAFGG